MAAPNGNTAIVQRFIEEGLCRGNLAVVDELVARDMVEHQRGLPPGPEGPRAVFSMVHGGFPDMQVTWVNVAEDGDKVWTHFRARGTHRGPFMGLPPTGRSVELDVIDVCRLANGKIVEHWGVSDNMAVAEQLGVLGGPGRGPEAERA